MFGVVDGGGFFAGLGAIALARGGRAGDISHTFKEDHGCGVAKDAKDGKTPGGEDSGCAMLRNFTADSCGFGEKRWGVRNVGYMIMR